VCGGGGPPGPPGGGGGGPPPTVQTQEGALRGRSQGPTDEFLGVPYAAAPVGILRWQPPVPAVHWTGVRQAGSKPWEPSLPPR
jgi:carboxylesterase type B